MILIGPDDAAFFDHYDGAENDQCRRLCGAERSMGAVQSGQSDVRATGPCTRSGRPRRARRSLVWITFLREIVYNTCHRARGLVVVVVCILGPGSTLR